MNDPIVCEKCGAPLRFFQEGRLQGLGCAHNAQSIVTTYALPIKLDRTIYQVRLKFGNHEDFDQIKAVAKVSRKNLLDARKLLKTSHPTVFKGNAVHVIEARNVLSAVDLEIEISPDFPW